MPRKSKLSHQSEVGAGQSRTWAAGRLLPCGEEHCAEPFQTDLEFCPGSATRFLCDPDELTSCLWLQVPHEASSRLESNKIPGCFCIRMW